MDAQKEEKAFYFCTHRISSLSFIQQPNRIESNRINENWRMFVVRRTMMVWWGRTRARLCKPKKIFIKHMRQTHEFPSKIFQFRIILSRGKFLIIPFWLVREVICSADIQIAFFFCSFVFYECDCWIHLGKWTDNYYSPFSFFFIFFLAVTVTGRCFLFELKFHIRHSLLCLHAI